ncbi:MAG TPA: chemotaxis protein CheX [Armatimonadota bacterium]|nr:chemotaxis protein CheX [Armatimonadota bacterium]
MRVEHINPFITAGIQVLEQFVGSGAEHGQLAVRTAVFTTQQISISVGVSGQLKGQVIYGMSQVTATKIASAMIGTQQVTFDEMAVSAISELGNIISGNATMHLVEAGIMCDITPPTVIRGINVEIGTQIPALVIPLYTKCGRIDINVAVMEAEEYAVGR